MKTGGNLTSYRLQHFKLVKIENVVLETMNCHLYRKLQTSQTTSSRREGREGVGKVEDCSPVIASSCAFRVNTGVSVLTSQQNT